MPFQTAITQEMPIGFKGMLADVFPKGTESMINSEASAEIAFGTPVKQGTLDNTALKIASTSDVITGITHHSHASKFGPGPDVGTTGVVPKGVLNVLRHGRLYVLSDAAVAADARAHYNTTTDRWRSAAVGGQTIDCTGQAIFRTSATAAGQLVVLEVDFRNEP